MHCFLPRFLQFPVCSLPFLAPFAESCRLPRRSLRAFSALPGQAKMPAGNHCCTCTGSAGLAADRPRLIADDMVLSCSQQRLKVAEHILKHLCFSSFLFSPNRIAGSVPIRGSAFLLHLKFHNTNSDSSILRSVGLCKLGAVSYRYSR